VEEKNNDHDDIAGSFDYVAFGCTPNLALQQELGLLSQWHVNRGSRDFTSANAHGPPINLAKISPLGRGHD
jgi:hypothetical protein